MLLITETHTEKPTLLLLTSLSKWINRSRKPEAEKCKESLKKKRAKEKNLSLNVKVDPAMKKAREPN